MPKGEVFVNAPPEQVFPAISDLTRHAKWASHDIEIQPEGDDTGQVGNQYTSGHAGKNKDQVTVTEVAPNQRFSFHVVMPNKMEIDHTMTLTPQNEGTLVTHNIALVKLSWPMALFKPLMLILIAMAGRGPQSKFLNSMKAELEQGV